MSGLRLAPTSPTEDEEELRRQVRSFLAAELPPGRYRPGLGMDADHDPTFSRALAARGWVGMAIPPEYGGSGRSPMDRHIVAEELLAAGAPVAAHWVADRQTAPTLLAYGTEEQKRRYLPAIAAGECYFSIGMSEPDAGSDLAAVRTRATEVDGGWSLHGTKIWTTNAHRNHFIVVLCRTSPPGDDRHHGLSQLIVDLAAPGVRVSPIRTLDGRHHVNEVVFEDVLVPHEQVLGDVGMGWVQVTSELSFERSGPDRYLSAWQLLVHLLAEDADAASRQEEQVGALVGRTWAVRQLSLSVARALHEGRSPAVEAAIVKDLGTTLEQQVVAAVQRITDREVDGDAEGGLEGLLGLATKLAPAYTIRGGTTEVLRSVAAKSLRERPSRGAGSGDLLSATLERIFEHHGGLDERRGRDAASWTERCWRSLEDAGLTRIGVPEAVGGAGGELVDACTLALLAGRHGVALPLAEGTLVGGWLAGVAGIALPDGPISVAHGGVDDVVVADGRASGVLRRVPWGSMAAGVLTVATSDGSPVAVLLDPADATVQRGSNLAGEARDTLRFDGVATPSARVAPVPREAVAELTLRGALARALMIAGGMQAVADLTIDYAAERRQFGRPIVAFQAVAHRLVQLVAESELVGCATAAAAERFSRVGPDAAFEVAVAKSVASIGAGVVAAHAHQVHGAVGMTEEHPLHHLTSRLWSWRQEWGSERRWAAVVGEEAILAGPDELWARVTRSPAARPGRSPGS